MHCISGPAPRAHQTRLFRASLFLFASLVVGANTASASSIQLVGSSTGCFGVGCDLFSETVTDVTFGLTFNGRSAFDVTTDAFGSFDGLVLGTFTRDNVNVSSELPDLPFTLQLLFTAPGSLSELTFSALIAGWSPGGGGPLTIDFNPASQTFALDGREVTMPLTTDKGITKNGQTQLIAGVPTSAAATGTLGSGAAAAEAPQDVIPVPEPATLVLLGSGLASVTWGSRRRQADR